MVQILIVVLSPFICQISFKRCDCWQDLLPAGANQDQAHGDRYHQERNNRDWPQRLS